MTYAAILHRVLSYDYEPVLVQAWHGPEARPVHVYTRDGHLREPSRWSVVLVPASAPLALVYGLLAARWAVGYDVACDEELMEMAGDVMVIPDDVAASEPTGPGDDSI